MVADARLGSFTVILAEDLDRLSRNQADIAGLYEQRTFAEVAIETVADGAVNEMHIGLKGTMSALFLRALALKTHRGQAGRVRAGKSAGGRSYGYTVTAIGERAIDVTEAAIVRRIFADTLRGISPRAIAAALNAEAIPSPRRGLWNASTIHGHARRQTGILRNALYAGEIVWNRQRFVKNPDTGKRVSRPNAAEAVMRVARPELRIVDPETWATVQAMLTEKSHHPRGPRVRVTHLMSGLLRCGSCGAKFIVMGGKPGSVRYGCAGRRERLSCDNRRLVAGDEVERRILAAIEGELLHEDVIAAAIAAYVDRRRQADVDRARDRSRIERRLGEIKRALARQMDEIEAGRGSDALHVRTVALETEQNALRAELGASETPNIVRLHPAAIARYRAFVRSMHEGLKSPDRAAVVAGVRELIDKVTVYPRGDSEGRDLELTGQLAALLQPEKLKTRPVGDRTGMVQVVAGARNHRDLTVEVQI